MNNNNYRYTFAKDVTDQNIHLNGKHHQIENK